MQDSGRGSGGDAVKAPWRLDWIPRHLNENVKLVLSVSDEDLLDTLKRDVVCTTLNYVQVCADAAGGQYILTIRGVHSIGR